ncbi:MAG: strawberry notch family protein, partial [Bifidobacterium sp.]|nr:strawberry notch family protein [Bifidobacterium sp.]
AGFVLGDQTGIGKGRVVASMIRYAYLNGKVPVFITEKQGLYADMYRDLMDIGMDPSIVDEIMQTNSDEVELYRNDDTGELVSLKSPSKWADTLRVVDGLPTVGKGNKAKAKKIVFTTYDQMNVGAKEGDAALPPRRRFLRQLVDKGNAMLIMDESHNAGGSGDLQNLRPDKRTGVTPYPRALFFRHLIEQANGVVYSSATYAKSPEVMSLYSATDLRLGVGGDINALAQTVTSGGIPFQQITASMLAESGQYIRRERSFEGVSYTPKVMNVDAQAAESVSSLMSSIRSFEETFITPAFESDPDAMGSSAVGDGGEKSQNFTALMHNIIDQMLLGLKVKPAVEEAIAILKAGAKDNEQVVLTVSNTMGAFIDEYAEATEISVGDEFRASFGDLLQRYLYKTREYRIKDNSNEDERFWLSDTEIGPVATSVYNDLVKAIAATDLSAVPVSPVDFMLNELSAAGFPALEITGRNLYIDYSGDRPILAKRPAKEQSVDGRTATIKAFNSGKSRAIILNRSGSTGISLHASERNPPAGRGKRTMIIVQAEKDINAHMQMLGRVHRTGQVVTPAYVQAVANIPAERKVAAVLVGKMSSLNANTTADKDSPLSDKSSVDFLNKYGDRVASAFLRANPMLNATLGWPYGGEDANLEGLMRKVTGRLPLLPIAEQETIYQALADSYNDVISELDATGRNDLEAKTFDLDAKIVDEVEVSPAAGASPFQGRVVAEKVDMKRIGKPYSSKEIESLLAESDSEAERAAIASATDRFDEYERDALAQAQGRIDSASTESTRAMAIESMDKRREELQVNRSQFQTFAEAFKPGETVSVNLNIGEDSDWMYGIVLGVVQRGEPVNPLALSTWRVRIAVADGIRVVNMPFSRFAMGIRGSETDSVSVRPLSAPLDDVKKLFDSALKSSRERRWIITGNLFTGYSLFRAANGRIINFTRDDGSVAQGILMPARFNPQEEMDKTPVAFENADQAITFMQQVGNAAVNLRQPGELKLVHLAKDDVFRVSTQSAVSKAGRFFRDDRALLDITGRFTSLGSRMITDELTADQVKAVFDLFARRGNSWFASDSLDVARGVVNSGNAGAIEQTSQGTVTGEENITYAVSEPRGDGGQVAGVVRDRAGAGVRAGGDRQLDLFTGATVPSLHQRRAARSVFAQVKHAAAGKFTFSGGPVGTMAEIAGIAKPIMDGAQESNLLVMLDEKNMPVAVLKHSVGGKASGPIDPGVVLGVAHSIKAVKTIWSVHNHPSGTAMLSGADRTVATLLADATRGTGINFAGMVAVTPGGRFTGAPYRDGAVDGGDFFGDATADKGAKVSGLTRKVKKLSDQPAVTNSNDINLWMMDNAPGQSGVLLLDNRNRPAAFVPMATATMAKLRTGEKGTGASELLAAAEQVNATALVPISTDTGKAGEDAARNIAVFAHAHAFTVLDALVDGQSARELVRETVDDHKWRGGAKSAASAFFSKAEAVPVGDRADIPGELAQAFGKLRARVLMRKITVLESQGEAKALVAALQSSGVDDGKFSVREKPAPKKTVKGYKLFRVDKRYPGKLFPLFVGANEAIDTGIWLDAEAGELTPAGKVKSKLGPLAYRPGWHGGDLPIATHIGQGGTPPTNRPANQVWAEVEFAADVDWQAEAEQRATKSKAGDIIPRTAHITDQVPADGLYRYKTNPNMTGQWIISGAMKVNRVLADAEVEAINDAAGVADLPRVDPFDAEAFGVKYSKNGAIQGIYANGKTYLVADGIAKNQAVPVLLHELGEHAAQLGFAGDREYQGILRSLEKRAEAQSATGEAIRAAMARVPADTAQEHYWSEVAAYLIENNANHKIGIVKRILNFFKRWLYRAGAINADRLTPEDLVLFARAATLAHTGATYGEGVRQSVASASPLSWDAPLDSKKDSFLYNAQNKFIDLFRVQDAIQKHGGTIDETNDVRLAEELYHKRSSKRVDDFLINEVKPLMAELAAVSK